MKEGYRLLGDFIRQVDVRNTDGKEENLLGVSVQKMFIPSIANTVMSARTLCSRTAPSASAAQFWTARTRASFC